MTDVIAPFPYTIERTRRRPLASFAGSRQEQVAKRMAFLAVATVAAGAVGAISLLGVVAWRVGSPFAGGGAGPYASIIVFATIVRAGLFFANRPDKRRRYHGFFDEIVEAVKEATLGSLAIVVFTFFWRDGVRLHGFSYSRSVFLMDWTLAIVLLGFVMCVAKGSLGVLRRSGHDQLSVVVVGSSNTSMSFVAAMDQHPETGYRIIGVVDDCEGDECDAVEELRVLAETTRVDEVVLATNKLSRSDIFRLVGLPELRNTSVVAAPDLFGLPPTKVRLAPVGDFPLLALGHEPLPGARRGFKRALDVIVAATVLVLTSPIMLVSALLIKLTSPGPILFRQDRVGMDGRPFRVLKFRTMRVDSDTLEHRAFVEAQFASPNGTASKLANDSRITRVGAILRNTSIDELPQLLTVLRGHMSIVGPRPALDYEVALYQDWQRRRLDVRPGLTGLWQVSGRSKLSFQEMHRLDVQYVETWTPLEDFRIVARTLPALLRSDAR